MSIYNNHISDFVLVDRIFSPILTALLLPIDHI